MSLPKKRLVKVTTPIEGGKWLPEITDSFEDMKTRVVVEKERYKAGDDLVLGIVNTGKNQFDQYVAIGASSENFFFCLTSQNNLYSPNEIRRYSISESEKESLTPLTLHLTEDIPIGEYWFFSGLVPAGEVIFGDGTALKMDFTTFFVE